MAPPIAASILQVSKYGRYDFQPHQCLHTGHLCDYAPEHAWERRAIGIPEGVSADDQPS